MKAQIEPNRMLNHGRRETAPAIRDGKHLAAYGPVGGHGQVVQTMPKCQLRPHRSPLGCLQRTAGVRRNWSLNSAFAPGFGWSWDTAGAAAWRQLGLHARFQAARQADRQCLPGAL